MNENQKKILKNLMFDIDNLKLLDKWINNFNLFDVLKITHTEIRHSNILSWLLDPNENHRLGDSFIRSFINNIVKQVQVDSLDLLMQDYYSYQVLREHNHIDITLLSREEKTAYIIENKIFSKESKYQLSDYYQKSQKEYSDYKLFYVFLTPYGHDASNCDVWIPISYNEIIPMLEDIINSSSTINNEVKLLVSNYVRSVRKDIMKEKDEKLIKICNQIYNKHRDAFKLIYENVKLDKSIESEIICNFLKKYSKENKIIYNDDNSFRFFTTRMNSYLPELPDNNSSWNTKWVYYYWLEIGDRGSNPSIIVHFEIGGWNIPNETKIKMDTLIKISKQLKNPVQSVTRFRYKRLFRKCLIINKDDYENSLETQVRKLVDLALDNENKIFNVLNNKQ